MIRIASHAPLAFVMFCLGIPGERDSRLTEAKQSQGGENPRVAFPVPPRGLDHDNGWSAFQLVEAYGALTAQAIFVDPPTVAILSSGEVPPVRAAFLPANQVQEFLEHALSDAGCVLDVVRAAPPRLVAVRSLSSGKIPASNLSVPFVSEAELSGLVEHPALLVSTCVPLAGGDARSIANQMRSELQDARTEAILPAGENCMYLRGHAPDVARWARALREGEPAERSTRPSEPQAAMQLARIPLTRADAEQVATALAAAVLAAEGDARFTVTVADVRTNALIVHASASGMEFVTRTAVALDQAIAER